MTKPRCLAHALLATTLIALPLTLVGVGQASARTTADDPAGGAGLVTASCFTTGEVTCYTPAQLREAYNVNPLAKSGIDGTGTTIAIVETYGSPTIENDLKVFDQTFGLPDPPSLQVIQPVGAVPPFDPSDSLRLGWAAETTLDVEYAHAMAPGAKILVVETPVGAGPTGIGGYPAIAAAENYVVDHGLADIISQSFGSAENLFPSEQSLTGLRGAFQNARQHNVTVLTSAGDTGATGNKANSSELYPDRVAQWPSTDPLVTSVGGTRLSLDTNGDRLAPDVAWNDAGGGATGGGVSKFFPRPAFQQGVSATVGNHRGTPDVSMSASFNASVLVYSSYNPAQWGYSTWGGTSLAAPLFAGVVALADQYAHHSLGYLNDALYRLGSIPRAAFVDVTSGNNTFGGVTGYQARPGYDLATGWGTVDAAHFVPALALMRELTP